MQWFAQVFSSSGLKPLTQRGIYEVEWTMQADVCVCELDRERERVGGWERDNHNLVPRGLARQYCLLLANQTLGRVTWWAAVVRGSDTSAKRWDSCSSITTKIISTTVFWLLQVAVVASQTPLWQMYPWNRSSFRRWNAPHPFMGWINVFGYRCI